MFLFSSLIPALLENGKYQEAADMIVKFQTDFDAAIPILCDGKLYAEALYLARVHAEHLIGNFGKRLNLSKVNTNCDDLQNQS